MSDKIKVAIKVRRLIDREENEGLVSQWEVKNNSIFQKDSNGRYREPFLFDHVFDSQSNNYEIFNTIARPIIDSSVSGFNGTIFAYGQTSSGKTYTMMGNQHEPGIIPQTIQHIFEALNKVQGREFLLRASYIEIYNEKVNDLLEKGKTGLQLREVEGTTIICGIKEEVVHTPDKIMQLMKRGENNRRIGETNMNERSSRSHTIFRIIIESRVPNEGEDGVVQVSHLNLVDLAGSERVDQTGSKGDRFKEGCSINRSLFMLSHVISQLSEGQDQYVNFRDSKLTRILQSSLGGNAHTAIICAVTPASIEETASTLGFASRAINVKNKPHINEVLSDAALLKRYARQIAKLQTELEKTKNRNKAYEVEEIESKLQEEQRRNELLQERIDLMQEQLIGSAAANSLALDKRRALRRRTWCGHASRKSLLSVAPSLQTINENSAHVFEQECLSSTIQELANNTFFETPLEEFELQLMDNERRLSADSLDTPNNVTFRRDKRRHVTFEDESELTENQSKKTVEFGSQTEPLPVNFSVTNMEYGTPPHILRERVMYYQKEYDELREFTTLEKQICSPFYYKETTALEMQNRELQKSVSDMEKMVLDVNCINSKLHDENKSLKERLAKESEKCNDMACHLDPVETALSQASQEVVELKKQLDLAAQRIKYLENERNDFEMARELAEARLNTRNKELTLSLEDAKVKLKELTQNAEDLTRISASNFDLNKLQDELIILREENVNYIQELKKKNEYLEQLKQENEKLKEKDLSVCLMNMEKEMIALRKINLLFIEQLKIKDESLEMHIKQIEELMAEKEQCLKYIEKCHKEMKQQNEKFTNVSICTSDVSKVQEEENSMKELSLMCNTEVMTEVNFLETMKQNTENVCAEQEPNVKYIEQLQERERQCEEVKESGSRSQEHGCLYDGLKGLTKIDSVCIKKINEKDECLETPRHQIEETYLKYSDQLQEKDTHIEQLKEQIEDLNKRAFNTQELCREEELNSATENNLLNTELKAKDGCLELMKTPTQHNAELIFAEEELKMLKEQGIWYDKGLSEEDNHHEILKKPTEHWSLVEMANSKYIDKMKEENVTMQEEVALLKEENSIKVKLRKDKDRYLETLKKQNKTLDSLKEASSKYIDELKANNVTVQKANVSLEEKNSLYREQLRQKDYYLEAMKQHIEDLNCEREAHLTSADELKADNVSLQAEIISLKENNCMYMRQVKEKDDCLETLKQKIEDLNTGKDANLKYIDELEANIVSLQKQVQSLEEKYSMYSEQVMEKNNFLEKMQQEIENLNSGKEANLKDINELKVNNESLKKEIISLQEKNSVYMVQLKEADSCLEALRQDTEHLNFGREANLKDINELKVNNDSLKKEIISLQEKNSMYMVQLKEGDSCLEALRQDIEHLNFGREANLKDTNELKVNNDSLKKEIISLQEKNSVYMEQLNEKDNYLETLKRDFEQLNSARETDLKYTEELVANNVSLETQIHSLEEQNSIYMKQVKEKDNCLESLKHKIEDLNCAQEANLKAIDELKMNIVSLQREINFLKEDNSMYMGQVSEKDSCLETLKHKIEDLNCAGEVKLTYIDKLIANIASIRTEIHSLTENNSVYGEQLNEKHSYLETLKQETEDLNCARETDLKDTEELEANESLQKEIISLEEKNSMYMVQLKEADSCLEALRQDIEHLNIGREVNLKDINELKVNNERLQKEIISLQEKNCVYMEQLNEKDNYLVTLKQETEHLNGRETNFKYIDELEANNVSLQTHSHSVQEKNSVYTKQVKEEDNCLETLKHKIEELNCAREANLKYIDELLANVASMQTEIHCLVEKNSMYGEQLKEKDHYLEILKQQTEDLNYANGRSLKNINDLRVNNERLQKEIVSSEERNSVYVEQLKERDDYLETLKQEIEDLNCARERNLKVIDELKVNNDSLQKEIISLEEKNSLYMEQLKEKDGYLETVKQVFEDVVTETETKLEHSDELKINIRIGKESNSIKEDNAMCSEQLKERDSYSETLKQQTEDMKFVKHDKLKYTEQLHEKNKCLDFLKHEIDPHSQEYGALAKIVECCITHVPTELSMITRSLSAKSHEIELCRMMILKEVSDLKPDYDVESVSEGQLTDLLKLLLTFVMEKEMEAFHSLEDKMNEIRIQANEAEKECANKNRQKDCWVRELEAEIEHLHAYVSRVEEEKKALEMDDKSHYLAILEQERNDLRKKLRQLDSDLVVVQLERNRMESRNKEMTRMLENLQLLLEDKSSQLQEEQENHFNKSQKLETLMKEIFDLRGKNVVLLENFERRNNDNNLLLKKVEDLQCAVMSKENENLDIVRKLSSLELELKVLSMKNSALEEEVFASKEIHSLLLKEKEHCSEITLNLKKVTEDVENLTVEKLAWDSEKEQLQAKVAEKQNGLSLERDIRCRLEKDMVTNIQKVKEEKDQLQNELSLQRDIRCRLEKDMMTNIQKVKEEKDQLQNELSLERDIRCRLEKDMMINTQKVKEEKDQLQVSYSHLLQNYEMLKAEVNNLHLIQQAHSLNVPDFMSQKPEITVTVPDENLVLKKRLEEKLQKQRELARRNENLATCITGLKEEVNRLGNENTNLRESVKTLSEEKNRLNALMYIKESEIEGFKRQLKVFFHEKSALVVACKSVQKPMQQQEDAVDCGNKEYSSLVSEKESCTENLGSRSQFSMRMADRTVQECRAEVSEERKLEEQLQVCMEEKVALSNENERLATDIHGLQKTLERYCVEKNSLEKSLEALEEERKKLVSLLSVSHKRFFDAENEVREMKLKMKKDETSQEKSVPRLRMAEAEVEHIQIRKKSLLQQCQNVGHNFSKRALYCQVQSQQVETGNVPKLSVATNTDISGSCQCKELTEKVHELKLFNAQQNNMIGNLKLQIRAEEFPYQQQVKELEKSVSFYKSKNMELRENVRHLNIIIKDSGCDSRRKPKFLQPKHVSVQTDEVKDEEFLLAGAGGSGIIREDQLMKMRIKVRNKETENEMLKELCRARRKRILDLEQKLETALGSQNKKEKEICGSGEIEGIRKQTTGAGSARGVGLTQYNKGFSSNEDCGQAGNKENFPDREEALQRPGRNRHKQLYMHDVRKPLNENVPSTEDINIPLSD